MRTCSHFSRRNDIATSPKEDDMKLLSKKRSIALVTSIAAIAVIAILLAANDDTVHAQPSGKGAAPISRNPGKSLLDPKDAVVLLLDHQTGLFQTVKDIGVSELRSNTIALAKLTKLMKIPVITTA